MGVCLLFMWFTSAVVSEDSPTVTLPLSSGPSSLGGSDTTSMNDGEIKIYTKVSKFG